MEPLAVIEITSRYLKVLIGYDAGEAGICAVYTNSFPLDHYIENGHIVNKAGLMEVIKEVSSFYDANMKVKFDISEAVLVLPPYGLRVYADHRVTPVISPDSKVHLLEIQTLFTMIEKGNAVPKSVHNQIVNIVPSSYILDDGKSYMSMPLSKISSSVTVDALLLTLPKDLINDFTSVFNDSGIRLRRLVVAPFAASELIDKDINTPLDYYILDIGAEITTLSLVGSRLLYNSVHFAWGSDNITKSIADNFHLSFEEAEVLKKEYGLDNTNLSFPVPICHSEYDGDHYLHELNAIIKDELDKFVEYLNTAVETLMLPYEDSFKNQTMILIGGGSLLNGLKEYLVGKVPSTQIREFIPSTLGARNPALVNLLGAIAVQVKYRDVLGETHHKLDQRGKEKKGGK